MKTYQSHKVVKAAQITAAPFYHEARGGWLVQVDDPTVPEHLITEEVYQRIAAMAEESEQRHLPGGYLIEYEDGYVSWSPASAFENGYTEVLVLEEGPDVLTFGFDEVIVGLKRGMQYERQGWNGRGMFIFLVPGSEFQVSRPPLLGIYPEGTEIQYHGHIDMKTADGQVVPWVASQTDLLAQDWVLV